MSETKPETRLPENPQYGSFSKQKTIWISLFWMYRYLGTLHFQRNPDQTVLDARWLWRLALAAALWGGPTGNLCHHHQSCWNSRNLYNRFFLICSTCFYCRISNFLVPWNPHWNPIATPIEIPWFPHGNISRNSAVAWRRTSTSSVSADPLDMWSRYLARQQRRATGGSWKWSTKWWLMVDKWWNMVISGD